MASLLRKARLLIRKPLVPRQFPTTGFEVIASSQLVEEETWEWYKPEEFYPVRIGYLNPSTRWLENWDMAHMVLPGFAGTYCAPLSIHS